MSGMPYLNSCQDLEVILDPPSCLVLMRTTKWLLSHVIDRRLVVFSQLHRARVPRGDTKDVGR